MAAQTSQPFRVNESASARITGAFKSDTGAAVGASQFTTLTATLYDLSGGTLAVINSRNAQDVLNANNGVVDGSGNFTFYMQAADNAVLDSTLRFERHRLLLEWVWDPSDGQGSRSNNQEIDIIVSNLNYVP